MKGKVIAPIMLGVLIFTAGAGAGEPDRSISGSAEAAAGNYTKAYENSDLAHEIREKSAKIAAKTQKTEKNISAEETTTEELAEQEEMGELELLACCTYAEAGNQGYEGMRKVAAVILNRVNSEIFPDTITDVILQKNQFEVVSNGRIYELWPTDECYDAVRDELLERSDTDILFFRTDRYSDYGTPAYKYGDHYFSY